MHLFNNYSEDKTMSLKRVALARVAATVCCALALQGCLDSNMTDLREFVETAYQDEKPAIDPLPPFEPYQAYKYEPGQDVDPFAISNIITNRDEDGNIVENNRPQDDRQKEDLEKFPLDALSFVGTITKEDVPWVIVQSSDGIAHLATVGNYMGQNDGQIKNIFPDEQRVVLVETVLDPQSRWVTRDVELTIDDKL